MTIGGNGRVPHPRLAGLIEQAGERARTRNRRVLVSVAEQVASVDPLDVLAALERGAARDQVLAANAAAGRMYWAQPREGFALAGLGGAATVAPASTTRFDDVDAAWAALRESAMVVDDSRGAPGVGPALMGGAAFEPRGSREKHWDGFPAALFVLPRVQVTTVNGASWLTTNVMVGPDGAPDASLGEIDVLRACAVGGSGGTTPRTIRESLNGDGSVMAHGAQATLDELRPGADWRALVSRAVSAIRAGGMTKVVLARAVHAAAPRELDVIAMLRHLRAAYPDCHIFGCWRGDGVFLGASPERLVRLQGRDVLASSLAGSAPRGADARQDVALAEGLMESTKDRAEHAIVRESLCAGLDELCDAISAPTEPSLFTLPHVHHLHTAVRARLRPGRSLLDLVAQLHPTPAVGGAPRGTALRFIRDHEGLDRGWYAAPIGWVGTDGGEFAVALRSAVVRGRDAWLFAGSGIVSDSDPDAEYAETLLKLRPMEQAIAAGLAAPQTGDGNGDADRVHPAGVGDGGTG